MRDPALILYGGGVELVAMGAAGTAALLIGIPVLVVVLVTVAVLGSQWGRAGRWRPGQPWLNQPMWFGRPGGEVPGGVVAIVTGSEVDTRTGGRPGGGARGQW